MPPSKLIAALSVTLAAACLSPPSNAQDMRQIKVCLTNKAWVVWAGTLKVHSKAESLGGQRHEFTLVLGKSKCVDVKDFTENPSMESMVNSNYGNYIMNSSVRNAGGYTYRLDGTVFSSRISVLDGVQLD